MFKGVTVFQPWQLKGSFRDKSEKPKHVIYNNK